MNSLNFKTYSQLAQDVRILIQKLPEDIDLVVGVPRSGMIPAYMIGAFLNLPVASLDEYLLEVSVSHGDRYIKENKDELKKVLIVDDSVNLGNALNRVKKRILENDSKRRDAHIFAAVYATAVSASVVDFYSCFCEQPRVFQWNYLNHGLLGNACVDIDGVLCVDPTPEQNDDGEKYINFLLNAKPLYIPHYKIRCLVTSRLEKYRPQTVEWLKNNNVEYESLEMLDLPSKEERIRLGAHGKFKSDIYARREDCLLFLESERHQAMEIAKNTGKIVICVSTDEVFYGESVDNERQCLDRYKKETMSLGNKIKRLEVSKSFRLGNLFFRSVKNPLKIITFPINFLKILFEEK